MAGGLVLSGISKAYGATRALAGVSMSAASGQVHALLGENGAGKSTLLGILAGAVAPDAGLITLGGAVYAPRGSLLARSAGVAMVHQELSLCPHLTVLENIVLGDEPARFGLLRRGAMRDRASAALAELGPAGSGLALDARVSELPPSGAQLVEIARALAQPGCRLLLLDEPTSSLAPAEVDGLFSVIGRLRARGLVIVYISHFLEEVRRIADTFTVLRDGVVVDSGALASRDSGALVEAMIGRSAGDLFPSRKDRRPGEVVLTVSGLGDGGRLRDASLVLRRGEVLGVAGLLGAGRTELLRAIFGLEKVRRGQVRALGYAGPASPERRLLAGVGLLSEDRKGEGLMLARSIEENLSLRPAPGLSIFAPERPAGRRQMAREWMDRLGIRARSPAQPAGELSGGNQQKAALGRLLSQGLDVLLLDEPTRGIDVGSKQQIYRLVGELAEGGKAVLLVSSHLPELLGLCDRVAVMKRGRLGPARPAAELTEAGVLLEASGS